MNQLTPRQQRKAVSTGRVFAGVRHEWANTQRDNKRGLHSQAPRLPNHGGGVAGSGELRQSRPTG